jgi:F420-dependent oxidoreductase-like protein
MRVILVADKLTVIDTLAATQRSSPARDVSQGSAMRISMLVPFDPAGIRSTIDNIGELERGGLDIVWVGEPYGFDAPTTLAYLAARTTTVQLGAGILPIYSRTPTLTAMTAAGLDFLSGGRAILGLGASGPQVIEGWHGVPYDKPLQRTREIVEIARKVWRREEPVVHDGPIYHLPLPPGQGVGVGKPLKLIISPLRPNIPIYIAALGEKTVTYTAGAADGWLPLFFAPTRFKQIWGDALAAGFAARPADLGPLEICAGGIVAIGADAADKRNLARPHVALYVGGMGARGHNFYNELFARYGYEEQAKQIQDLYLAGKKREAEAAIPDAFLEEISLCGPPSYVKERIAAYREAGVTVINVDPTGSDPVRTVADLAELV